MKGPKGHNEDYDVGLALKWLMYWWEIETYITPIPGMKWELLE